MGGSPAMPLSHNDRIYAATSDEWISLLCDEQSCIVDSVVPFHSNGELSIRIVESEIEIWAPSNTLMEAGVSSTKPRWFEWKRQLSTRTELLHQVLPKA